jgi:predicted nuclease with TOPRIM domain
MNAEITAQMFKLTETIGEMKTDMAVHAEKQASDINKIGTKLDSLQEDVSDVKESTDTLKEQLSILSKRMDALESKKTFVDNIVNLFKSCVSFFSKLLQIIIKFKNAILIITGLVAIFFGKDIGLDVQATIALLLQLFS